MNYFEDLQDQESKEAASVGPVPANYSKRIGATVVDILITTLAWMPAVILGVIGFVDGVKEVDSVEKSRILPLTDGEEGEIFWEVARGSFGVAAILGAVALIWSIWYFGYRQGKTGLTPGKRIAGTKLINIETGGPLGGAAGIGRFIVPFILSGISGVYFLLDYLWPLWDEKNQRITDKMFSTQVVLKQGSKGDQGVSSESGVTDRNDSLSGFDQGLSGDDPIIS